MAWFCCHIEGENFPLATGGQLELLGFFTTRWVEAVDAQEAENKAVALISADRSLVIQHRADITPMIFVRRIDELAAAPLNAPGSGFTFFPMGS